MRKIHKIRYSQLTIESLSINTCLGLAKDFARCLYLQPFVLLWYSPPMCAISFKRNKEPTVPITVHKLISYRFGIHLVKICIQDNIMSHVLLCKYRITLFCSNEERVQKFGHLTLKLNNCTKGSIF